MGNSTGNVREYWEFFRAHRVMQGGFVWDWVDQGLNKQRDDGKGTFWAYGGAFGERVHDKQFNINGLVFPDRTAHPGLFEMAHVQQPVAVSAGCTPLSDDNTLSVSVHNRYTFVSLAHLVGRYVVEVDGHECGRGELSSAELRDLRPSCQCTLAVHLPALPVPVGARGTDVFVTIEWALRERTNWAPDGHIVARDQLQLARACAAEGVRVTKVRQHVLRAHHLCVPRNHACAT